METSLKVSAAASGSPLQIIWVGGPAVDQIGRFKRKRQLRRVGLSQQDRARLAQGVGELDLAAAIGGQVLDQQGALALGHIALDPGVAAEALGRLADILHGQKEPLGEPGGVGDPGGLAARHGVELLVACDVATRFTDAARVFERLVASFQFARALTPEENLGPRFREWARESSWSRYLEAVYLVTLEPGKEPWLRKLNTGSGRLEPAGWPPELG